MILIDTPAKRQALDGAAASAVFLSQVLLSPEAAVAAQRNLDAQVVATWPGGGVAVERGLSELRRAVAKRVEAAALIEDHRRLFVGPGTMLACPWESVHCGDEGLVFDEAAIEVRAAYAAFGLVAPGGGREPDDHIGLECSFVAELSLATLDALEAGDAATGGEFAAAGRRFVDEHLGAWAPELGELIVAGAQTAFYRAVGHLLSGAVPLWREAFAA